MPAKPLLEVLRGNAVEPPPVWLMRQAGRYLPEYRAARAKAGSFLDLCYDPALAAEVTLQPVDRFGLDGAIIFSDILVVPHALGQDVRFEEGRGPVLEPIAAADLAWLDAAGAAGRLEPVYAALRRVKPRLPEHTALIGFAGAPWTVATYMIEGGSSRDFLNAKGWAYRDPGSFAALIEILVEAIAAHLVAQAAAGAEAVQIFDTWAGALPAEMQDRWSVAPIRAIAERVKAAVPSLPVIVFPRGVGVAYARYAAIDAVDAVGFDTAVPAAWMREAAAGKAAQGNLDPAVLVAGGAALDGAAASLLQSMRGAPHVFNLGHGVVPPTPPENVARLVSLVRGTAA
ncbi:MAG: uroporphyrinogen decarboxylase [Rhodospirillaceae bacterium]